MTRPGFFRSLLALFGLGAVRCAPQLAFAEDAPVPGPPARKRCRGLFERSANG